MSATATCPRRRHLHRVLPPLRTVPAPAAAFSSAVDAVACDTPRPVAPRAPGAATSVNGPAFDKGYDRTVECRARAPGAQLRRAQTGSQPRCRVSAVRGHLPWPRGVSQADTIIMASESNRNLEQNSDHLKGRQLLEISFSIPSCQEYRQSPRPTRKRLAS